MDDDRQRAAPSLPRTLTTIRQPLPDDLSRCAVLGLGDAAMATRRVVEGGLVPPDVLVGASLFLLASQPKPPRPSRVGAANEPRKSAVAGAVWVREQVTFHHPVSLGQELVLSGESAQRFVRRGRLYGVTVTETRSVDGALLVSNRTTGLLRYRKDEKARDAKWGRADEDLPPCGVDVDAAGRSPAGARLAKLSVGERFDAERAVITLEMMRARDGARDQNPIHTDPEVARREGLAAPIAGGSHVLSFLLEALLEKLSPEALLYGAHLDVRFTGQTFAGSTIDPSAVVVRADHRSVLLDLEVRGEDRVAMSGTLEVPLPPGARPAA